MMNLRQAVCKHAVSIGVAGGIVILGPGPAKAQERSGSQAPSVTAAVATAAASAQAGSQDSGFLNFFRGTELFGTADVYYTYSSNEPDTGSLIPLRVFDSQHNNLSIALAEVGLSKPVPSANRVGFRFDLDFGPVADAVNAFEPGGETFRNIQQAYISYMAPVGKGLTFDFGKFVTQHGAEVIEAKDNWNYSRSILFGFAIPFYHVGLRMGYAPTDKVSLLAAIVNGWNNSTDNNSQKTYGLQAIVKPVTPFSIVLNYMGGPEQTGNTDDWRHLFDTTLTYTATEKLSVMANVDYGRDQVGRDDVSWWGVALYAKAQPTPIFAIIPRIEYYDDSDGGFTTGTAQKVKEFTLTAEVKHSQGLIMRLEYRGDWSDRNYFTKRGRPRDNQHTFTVGWVYGFSTKQ